MEEQDNRLKHFEPVPPEYAHLEELASETHTSLMAIDQAIAEMPKDKGPTYELKPTWADSPPQLSREQKITNLLNSKRDVVTAFHKKMDEALINAKPEAAQSIKNTLNYRIDTDNRFNGQPVEKVRSAKSQPKDIDRSQDIALVDLYNRQLGIQGKEGKAISTTTPKELPAASNKEMTLAQLYENKFDITEGGGTATSGGDKRSPEIEPEKD